MGKLAMLDGDPGLGKSLLALDLCAHLSTGQWFPLGRAKKELRIRTRRVMRQPQQVTYWLLEGQELPRDEREAGDGPSIEEMLAELERQFPQQLAGGGGRGVTGAA